MLPIIQLIAPAQWSAIQKKLSENFLAAGD